MSHVYIGVDPGATGAIAIIDKGRVETHNTPKTEQDILNLFLALADTYPERSCVLEQVQGFIGGEREANGSAMFNFGWNYGSIRMALLVSNIAFDLITPQVWQKALKIPSRNTKKKETRNQFKNRLKATAQRLFPSKPATLTNADAMLIAEYCRRYNQGILT